MEKKAKKSLLEKDVSIGGVSIDQKVVLVKNLSIMLKAGLTITEALKINLDQASGKLKKVLRGVLKSVMSGHSLSESLNRYPRIFTGLLSNIVQAGEISGTLEENLKNIAQQLERDKELRAKIKGAMFYPIVVLVAAFLLGIAVTFLVLPKITPLFEGLKMDLPITTRVLIFISHAIKDNGVLIFLGLAGFIILTLWLVKRKFSRPITHYLLLKIPLLGNITKKTNITRLCGILGILLKSGLNINEALEVVQKTLNNYYYQDSINDIVKSVTRGGGIANNLAKYPNLYPKIMVRMIQVGEKSGKLEEVLFYLADYYNTEVENSTKSLSNSIEPVLLIIIGLGVGFLALSIITPIYEITGNVRR